MAYFDAASAEPLHPVRSETLLTALAEGWADPARLHREGRRARLLLDQAREAVAAELGCRPDELSFTTSGTQAVHLAILGAVAARQSASRGPGHLVTSAVEHSSVLNAADWLSHRYRTGREHHRSGPARARGPGRVHRCPAAGPDAAGVPADRPTTRSATLQPTAAAAAACAERRVPLFVDAAATAGRLPTAAGWSLLAASAHKWGGPAGVGVLAIRKGVRWREPGPADDRESRRVPGFPNVPAVLAAAAALTAMAADQAADAALLALTNQIRRSVPAIVPDAVVHGDPDRRLPHIVTFSCLYVDGETLVTELDRAGFSVSSGSACVSDTRQPSHVLAAMGVLTHGNVRVSLPRSATPESVEEFLTVLPPIVARVRETVRAATSS